HDRDYGARIGVEQQAVVLGNCLAVCVVKRHDAPPGKERLYGVPRRPLQIALQIARLQLGAGMFFNLNLLHLLLVLAAAVCVRMALREIRGRSMSPSRLAMLPLVAVGMTFVFLLFF